MTMPYNKKLDIIRDMERLYMEYILDSNVEGPGNMQESYRAIHSVVTAIMDMAQGDEAAPCAMRAIKAITALCEERNP